MSGLSKPKGTGGDEGRTNKETWIGVSGESFTRQCKKGDPGAMQVFRDQERTDPVKDDDGNDKYRTEHSELTGKIIGFGTRTAEMRDKVEMVFLTILLKAGDETFRIDVPEFKRHWENFLMRLPGVDFTKEVQLKPYSFLATNKDSGKESLKQGITIYQDGEKLPTVKIEGLPDATQAENPKTGKMEWTFLARNKFLRDKVLVEAKARLAQVVGEPVEAAVSDGPGGTGLADEDEAF